MNEYGSCDRCGLAMKNEGIVPVGHRFVLPTEDDAFEAVDYHLCTGCQEKIVEFIEGEPRDEGRVEPATVDKLAKQLERTAKQLEREAAAVRSVNNDD